MKRWVENNPTPSSPNEQTPKSFKNNNNNTIDFISQTFWNRHQKEEMPMLLQQAPAHVLLSGHETDQPLDFTMSKFKTKNPPNAASQLKQFNSFAAQQMMLLQNNGLYFNRTKSYARPSSPSSSSEEEGVGPPRSPPPSPPVPLRSDGKLFRT